MVDNVRSLDANYGEYWEYILNTELLIYKINLKIMLAL